MNPTAPIPYAGEIAALAAALIWACSITVFTIYGSGVAPRILNLYKNIVAMIGLLAASLLLGETLPQKGVTWLLLITSGLIGLSLGDTAAFKALYSIGVRLTSAIQCLAPPLAALLAYLFLDERLSWAQILGMAITLGCVTSIVWIRNRTAPVAPLGTISHTHGVFFAVVAAVSQAVGLTLARRAFTDSPAITGTLIRMTASVIALSLLHSRAKTEGQTASLGDITRLRSRAVALTLASFAGTCVGITLASAAIKYAKAGIAASLMATFPLWVIAITRVYLKERIEWGVTVLTIIAVLGVVLMLLP